MQRVFSMQPFLATATAGAALASVLLSNPAQAFTLSIAPSFGSTENTGSTASLNFGFEQVGNNVLLNLGIKNTTNGTVGLKATQSTLVGVALDLLTDKVKSFTYNAGSSSFAKTFTNVSIPGPFGETKFDYGIRSAGSGNTFVGGNPQAGLLAGESTLVSFLLKGTSALKVADVESSYAALFASGGMSVAGRFQQVKIGGSEFSDKVLGGFASESGASTSAAGVPEPATMLGMFAAGGLLFGRKKLQRRAK